MRSVDSLPKTTISGRRFTRRQLRQVQQTVEEFGNLSRTELTLTVCEHLDWRTPKGKLKLESCRKLLETLERHGVLSLPAVRKQRSHVSREPLVPAEVQTTAIRGSLSEIAPVGLRVVSTHDERQLWKAYLHAHHYLGYKRPFGAHLGYIVHSEKLERDLGCLVFSASAAWAMAPRDRWIGWDDTHRKKLLHLILSNDRFLILPWVEVPHLASHVLSLVTGRVASDWVEEHGYRPVLIETFVDPTRFSGACYRAANWTHVGLTQGRGRGDTQRRKKKTKKDIYVFPLQSDWQASLTEGHRDKDLKKRYRNDLLSSHTRSVGEEFVALWAGVAEIVHEVAAEYDRKWQVRRRVVDSLLLVLLIFRLVSSKNAQSYGTTIDDLWDSCDRLELNLKQKSSIAPSTFCAARKKLDESIFRDINSRILEVYAPHLEDVRWHGRRLFAVDGSKVILPRQLVNAGYKTPNQIVHYPQGLLSCLFDIRSRVPVDFDLVPHSNERDCALQHLRCLGPGDVVVYDRGYYSYAMLHHHVRRDIHAIFRLQEHSSLEIRSFFASDDTERRVTIVPSSSVVAEFRKRYPGLEVVPLALRLVKYRVGASTFCLGTTLVDGDGFTAQDFMDLYHSRWGVEELFKTSKQTIQVEDFHARSERGVKQELFAHFVLITMTRVFANHADIDLNQSHSSNPSAPTTTPDSLVSPTSRYAVNFKNCFHVIQRSFEELVLLEDRFRASVQRAFNRILRQHPKTRPDRSYPRISHKTGSRWRPAKEKRRQRPGHYAPSVSP